MSHHQKNGSINWFNLRRYCNLLNKFHEKFVPICYWLKFPQVFIFNINIYVLTYNKLLFIANLSIFVIWLYFIMLFIIDIIFQCLRWSIMIPPDVSRCDKWNRTKMLQRDLFFFLIHKYIMCIWICLCSYKCRTITVYKNNQSPLIKYIKRMKFIKSPKHKY